MKLLVVEDEALLRHHLQTRLTDSGHVVESVANAEGFVPDRTVQS
jgi:two-component system response regulator PhoP